jgi:hypothetical protein
MASSLIWYSLSILNVAMLMFNQINWLILELVVSIYRPEVGFGYDAARFSFLAVFFCFCFCFVAQLASPLLYSGIT